MSKNAQIAIMRNITFNYNMNFVDLSEENIKNKILDSVEFYTITCTMDLFNILQSEYQTNSCFEITNCLYTKDTLIQSFHIDTNPKNDFILVKRKINNDDSYTYIDFDQDFDKFEYLPLELSDVIQIIRSKYISIGIYISADNDIHEIEYINRWESKDISSLLYRNLNTNLNDQDNNDKNIMYLNLPRILIENKKSIENPQIAEQEDTNIINNINNINNVEIEIEQRIHNLLSSNSEINYIYNQQQTPCGLINCFNTIFGHKKNQIMSDILNTDIYGDVLVGLENNFNNSDDILNLNKNLFIKIIEVLSDKTNKKHIKNKHFYNIYYELL
jgi:hypothetical protein